MAARWLVVKVMDGDDNIFDSQYKLNQLEGVDCMEVTAESHPQLYREMVDNFDEDRSVY